MSDWFRNTDWDADIADRFNAKLARSRGQKAQYLRIQGSILKDTHPRVAIELLGRCVALGDDLFVAPALMDMAHAYYRLGDVAETLACLEAVIVQEARAPFVRTSASFDYAMLVVLHGQADRFEAVLEALEDAVPLMPVMEYQREAAQAVIFDARGDAKAARRAADRAKGLEGEAGRVPGHPFVGSVPTEGNPLGALIHHIRAKDYPFEG